MLRLYLLVAVSAHFATVLGVVAWAALTLLYSLADWEGLYGSAPQQIAAIVLTTFVVHFFVLYRFQLHLIQRCKAMLLAFSGKWPWLGTIVFITTSLWAVLRARRQG